MSYLIGKMDKLIKHISNAPRSYYDSRAQSMPGQPLFYNQVFQINVAETAIGRKQSEMFYSKC